MTRGKVNGWKKWIIFATTIAILIAGWIWYASSVATSAGTTIERVDKAEVQIDANVGDIRELKTDVKYIREGIDRIEKRLPK